MSHDATKQILSMPSQVAAAKDDLIMMVEGGRITSRQHIYYVLCAMCGRDFAKEVMQSFIGDNVVVNTDIASLALEVHKLLHGQINWQSTINTEAASRLKSVAEFEQRNGINQRAYEPEVKPKPDAVFWPDPTREGCNTSVQDTLPFVKKYPLLDKTTPIGTAGSCFAFEISKRLQENGFNYVVTERADDPEQGVIVDAYKPGDPYALFSANYGIMFNTPSFCQLAEKAFDEREFKKILLHMPSLGLYADPYRENVFFKSQEAYLADYPRHIAAVKQALLRSKVFVLTLGLNECWQLTEDDSFISRNPKGILNPYLQHRVLTVQDNVYYVQRFIDIVRKYNPDMQVILSVSPIPLLATARADEYHVVEANAHSKAVLRVAAEEIVNQNEGVFYFPSYEYVMHCAKTPWEKDGRHVTRETVSQVIAMFEEIFTK